MTNNSPLKTENPLPLEEVVRLPQPGMAIPGKLAFSPDDQFITYLHSPRGSLERQLFAFDPQTGRTQVLAQPVDKKDEGSFSLEEALRRERQRQREVGVTHYEWSQKGSRILIPSGRELFVLDQPGRELRALFSSPESAVIDPRFSPDGNWVAFAMDAEVYIVPVTGGDAQQVTQGARGTGKTNGLAEFIAQEEMGRHHGYWWSPDSRRLAFEEVDETHIPVYRIVHQGKDRTGEGAQEDHRYPFAGQPNARVRLGVIRREGGEPTWMDLGPDHDIYVARVDWLPDGRLAAQIQNREQDRLDLVVFNPESGARTTLLTETSPYWINLHDMFYPLNSDHGFGLGGFIWASERTGFRHLYLYDASGKLVRALTSGEWMVDSLAGVDEEVGVVYFTGTLDTPLESHLYAAPLEGGAPRRLTLQPGMHTVTLDHACQRFLDTSHALDRPPSIVLRSLEDGSEMCTLFAAQDERIERLGLEPPEIVSLHNRYGDLLYGALFRPPARYGRGPFPTIVLVYGGPHVQLASNAWTVTVNMRAQYYRSLGFLVFMLDNRGSARRGLAFESAVYRQMGNAEVEDQVDGVHWLVDQGLADPQRVGINGWSYGGYMSAMCLARAPKTFKVAVAGAPVTHYDGYDTHYTERYMGTPQNNPDGYTQGSVLEYVENLQGKLMLVHGLIDENVHFRHTARLINALIRARKPYDLLLFPDERHTPRKEEDRIYMEERICAYFQQNL